MIGQQKSFTVSHAILAVLMGLQLTILSTVTRAQQCAPIQTHKIKQNVPMSDAWFGQGIAIEHRTATISAPGANNYYGAVIIHNLDGCQWVAQAELTSETQSGSFGDNNKSIDISGDTVVVGASHEYFPETETSGSVYIYKHSNGQWTMQAKLAPDDGAEEGYFGQSVAISGDTLVVGATTDSSQSYTGVAYVYTRTAGTWTLQTKLRPADANAGDEVASAVAIQGNTIVLGAYFGDGNSPNSGAAYVYTRAGTTWTQEAKLFSADGTPADLFGRSVDLSDETIIVGSSQSSIGGIEGVGSAYVFVRTDGLWTQQAKLIADDGGWLEYFGDSVAIHNDTALIGVNTNDNGTNSGSAYLFHRSGGQWTQQAKLLPHDGAAQDAFGNVALYEDRAIIGAWRDDNTGSAYAFDLACTTECTADVNGDGQLDFFDVSEFLQAYSNGCP